MGWNTVTSASFTVFAPYAFPSARRVEPTPTGPSEVQYSVTSAGYQAAVFSTLLSTENTSSTGRAMVTVISLRMERSFSDQTYAYRCGGG